MAILTFFLYTIFVVSSILLIAIVLLQEGKGGGFGEAFGGMVSESFGVRASGAMKLTAGLAGAFVLSAILISMFHGTTGSLAAPTGPVSPDPGISAPADPGTGAGGGDDAGSGEGGGDNAGSGEGGGGEESGE